jgi:hypothetical protein
VYTVLARRKVPSPAVIQTPPICPVVILLVRSDNVENFDKESVLCSVYQFNYFLRPQLVDTFSHESSSLGKNSSLVSLSSSETTDDCLIFLCQRVNTATSSPADDVHHYIVPQKILLTNRFYFQQTFGIHAPVGK